MINLTRRWFLGAAAATLITRPVAIAPQSFWVSLRTEMGEAEFQSYARVRGIFAADESEAWINPLDFPTCTGGEAIVTHFAIHANPHGGPVFESTVTPNIFVCAGVTARLLMVFFDDEEIKFIARQLRQAAST